MLCTILEELIDDSNAHFAELSANPAEVLAHIGSPFALDYDSTPQDLAA
ncbi:MAG: hypothetical protein M1370_10760 [Bacteroidetes bacterium]|nr:hypothetical protein [Bacteroidota bacterium]MCL5026483.1 hypothetical protein [Chloroflexota bacterium]